MSTEIRPLTKKGVPFYPQTHVKAIVNDNGSGVDSAPTKNSNNLVESGGVFSAIFDNTGAFDISRYNAINGVPKSYSGLTDALSEVPQEYRSGGMSVKYVQSSDNKYVQYLYKVTDAATTATFTNVANWEKVNLEEELNQLGKEVNGNDNSQDFDFAIATGVVDYRKTVDVKAGKYNITVDDSNNALPQYTRIYLNGTSIGYLKSLTNPVTISEDVTTILLYATAQATNSGDITIHFADANPSLPLRELINEVEEGLSNKVDKVTGKTLSTNDYTNTDKGIVDDADKYFDISKTTPTADNTGYFIYIDGTKISNSSYSYSNPIAVHKGDMIIATEVVATRNVSLISKVDENGNFIEIITRGQDGRHTYATFIDEDCYVCISAVTGEFPLFGIYSSQLIRDVLSAPMQIADRAVTSPKIADGAVTEEKTIFFEHDTNSNFIDRSKLTPGYYINANGVPTATESSNYFITDKVFLTEGETYYKGNLFGGYCAFYREDGTLVQGYGSSAPFLSNPFVVPQGAVYGRFTLNSAGADKTCWISKTNVPPIDYRLVIKRNLIPAERTRY